jgi:hypothetical protein
MSDQVDTSDAAKTLGRLGGLKGGKARAEKLTPGERTEIAKHAVTVRWERARLARNQGGVIPAETHPGTLEIGSLILPCAVLGDGTRVINQEGFLSAIGRARKAKGGQGASVPDQLPAFLAAKNLKPFISQQLEESLKPIVYKPKKSNIAYGYEAQLIPEVCKVYLEAREAGKLTIKQLGIARQCEILVRGLAAVGIVALVDEATGYQEERERAELRKILQAYISGELLAWTERFPREFYREMFRLHGWQFDPVSVKRPRYIGKLTKELVYKQLPKGVLEELESRNPPVYKGGQRKYQHHRFLTADIGNPHLEKQVLVVTSLMKAADNWDEFKRMFAKNFSAKKERQEELPFANLADDEID